MITDSHENRKSSLRLYWLYVKHQHQQQLARLTTTTTACSALTEGLQLSTTAACRLDELLDASRVWTTKKGRQQEEQLLYF